MGSSLVFEYTHRHAQREFAAAQVEAAFLAVEPGAQGGAGLAMSLQVIRQVEIDQRAGASECGAQVGVEGDVAIKAAAEPFADFDAGMQVLEGGFRLREKPLSGGTLTV